MPASTRKRKTKGWELDVCYPASHFPKADKDVEEATGVHCHSSGCGFGERDMQFHFNTKPEAEAARKRVMANCPFCHIVETHRDV